MAEKRLNILQDDNKDSKNNVTNRIHPSLQALMNELQARFERLWLLNPEQFNPLRNCMQRERLDRTWHLLHKYTHPEGKFIADMGCGAGVFSRRLRDAGGKILAADIAENALKHLKQHDCTNIECRRETMPATTLPDNAYDIVVCTEVISELPSQEYRLFFSELARLIKPEGYVICSTAIDIHSENAVEHFTNLVLTEFDLLSSVASYHALYLRIKRFLEIPETYIKASGNEEFKKQELAKRSHLGKGWFKFNSSPFLAWLWIPFSYVAKPFLSLMKNNRTVLIGLEKICRFLWDEAGISHFIIIGQRRKLTLPEPEEMPIERPKKRMVWE